MSINVTVDGVSYNVPQDGERGWGTEVTNLLVKLAQVSLLIKGGSIPLTSEADFGASYGLKSIYFKSRTANPASTGVLRLANTDAVKWRNGANGADLTLGISSDRLQYEGLNLVATSTTDTLTNKTINAALNTLSNIDTTMLASGVLVTSTSLTGASNLNWPSTLAVKTYVDNQIGAHDDASEVTYTPTTGADWPDPDPTTVQSGLDKLAAERALTSSLTTHTGASTGVHGVTSAVVGTTDSQTLTNKTLTSPIINTSVSGTAIETDLSISASSTKLPTAAAAKAYADSLVGSGINTLYGAKSADYTILNNDNYRTIGVTTSTTDRTITLPAAASNSNRVITITKIDNATGLVIITSSSSELAADAVIGAQWESLTVQSTGSSWVIIDGKLHQYKDSVISSTTDAGATGVYVNITSLSLCKGEWDITGVTDTLANGATPTQVFLAVSTYSGNTTTDHVDGQNVFVMLPPTATSTGYVMVPSYKLSLNTTTTVYLKYAASYPSGGPPRAIYSRISARRVGYY